MDALGVLLVLGMVVPSTGFPLLYLTFYRWWAKPIGRALMTKAVGLGLLVDVSLLHEFFGNGHVGWDVVRLVTYVLILVGLWYQFIVFLRIRLEERSRPKATREQDQIVETDDRRSDLVE